MNIAVYNQKGGTGKTTTSVNLSAAIAELGGKVTLVDLCPQGDATLHLGYTPGPGFSPFESEVEPVVIKENMRLIPAAPRLLSEYDDQGGPRLWFGYLEKGETLILDCPPNALRLSALALLSSQRVIVPITPGFLPYSSTDAVRQYLDELAEGPYMKNKPSLRVLLTQFSDRRRVDRMTCEALEQGPLPVFDTKIPGNTDLNLAASKQMDIFSYAPRSKGAQAYLELAQEVIAWLKRG